MRSPMASKTEGIALLSMYNDEDEEDDEEQQPNQETGIDEEPNDLPLNDDSDTVQDQIPSKSPQNLSSPSPEIRSLRSPTPPPWPQSRRSSPMILTSTSPGLPTRPPSERVAIVDYAHDEAGMSPEAEEGEITSSSYVVISMEIQASNGNIEERTPPGTVQLLTPSIQAEPPQPSDVSEQSRSENSMAIDSTATDLEIAQTEIAIIVSAEVPKDDPSKKFLPPPVTTMCLEELQIKINKFLAYKKSGKSFNAALRNRKDYRNPDFLQHAVRYQDIDQIGTCFDKDVFDPHGYDKSDYFDEIGICVERVCARDEDWSRRGAVFNHEEQPSGVITKADMKREAERKEQERKRSQKVDFVPGGTQPGTAAPALKTGAQIPVSAAADSAKETRQNKKTKWDKIDGDIPSVGLHAAHLSTANAGTGYTAFAQQKRREAEEKRSGEVRSKPDKRS